MSGQACRRELLMMVHILPLQSHAFVLDLTSLPETLLMCMGVSWMETNGAANACLAYGAEGAGQWAEWQSSHGRDAMASSAPTIPFTMDLTNSMQRKAVSSRLQR